jgi:fucose permease
MSTPRSTLAVTWSSIFVVGIVCGAIGPLLPQLALRLSVPVEALGTIFPAISAGSLVTQVAGGWLNERFGLRTMVLAGTALMTLGMVGFTVSPTIALLLASTCLIGLGQGALDISTNVLVAAVFPKEKVVSAVNLLHFAFGSGAVLGPVVASAATRQWGTPMPTMYLAAAVGLGIVLLGGRLLLSPSTERQAGAKVSAAGIYRSPALWLLAFLLFLYVGGEMGVGGWTTVYLTRTSALSASAIALIVSAFWLALTGGRLIGAALGTHVRAGALLLWSASGSLLGALVILGGGGNAMLTAAGTILVGLCYGPIFPTAVVMATETFPSAPSRAVSLVVSLSSVGTMALPPLQGILLERVSPFASVGLVAAGAAAMVAVVVALRRGTARQTGSVESAT